MRDYTMGGLYGYWGLYVYLVGLYDYRYRYRYHENMDLDNRDFISISRLGSVSKN